MDTKVERDSGQGIVMTVRVDVSDFLAAAAGRTLDILFDHDPRSPEGHLVEVESPAGTSVKVGTWIDCADNRWALRLTLADFLTSKPECAPERGCGTESKAIVPLSPADLADKIRIAETDTGPASGYRDSITAQERSDGSIYLTQSQTEKGPHSTVRMDPLVIAHFLGWLEDTELFKSVPRGFSNLLPEKETHRDRIRRAQADVEEFHRAFDITTHPVPTMPNKKLRNLRADLIEEEAREFREAAELGSFVGMVDAAIDTIYVCLGALLALGVDAEPVWSEVHRSNMSKAGGHKAPNGKWIKPDTYSPADIAHEITKQEGKGGLCYQGEEAAV